MYLQDSKKVVYGLSYVALKPYGNLFIAEPKNKWSDRTDELKKQVESVGFKVINLEITNRFVYLDGIK